MYGRDTNINMSNRYEFYSHATKEFDIEKICKYYDLYYNYNLKTSIEFFEPRWVKASEFIYPHRVFGWDREEEKINLINDILNHKGFFNPIYVFETGGEYDAYVGNHRVSVICEMYQKGLIDGDREFLVFIIPKSLEGTKRKLGYMNDHPDTLTKLPHRSSLFFPSYLKPTIYKNVYVLEKIEIDKGLSVVTTDRVMGYYKMLNAIPHALSTIMSTYKNTNGKYIPEVMEMCRFLNDKELYHAWMRSPVQINIDKYFY